VHFGLTVALCEASEMDAALRHGYRGLELARQAADENDQADCQLSPREHELVTLVARGGTNAQIAIQLYISIRTVGSHLDPIRDKTGCRRCTDLTRLALQAGLV
jgi:DNA-binding CsgD family transcriptional regulator